MEAATMRAEKSWAIRVTVSFLSMYNVFVCSGAEPSPAATQSVEIAEQYLEQGEADSATLQAEYVFELEKPLLPAPLAEKPSRSRPKISNPRATNSYKYYYKREEIEGPRTIEKELEKIYRQNYARPVEKSQIETVLSNRYLPNSLEAESVAAHLREAREKPIREACRNNLRLIANAVDDYFREHPDEIIKRFDENDVTSLAGKFVRNGYLKEPIKVEKGCSYIHESRLSELISGSQIYCRKHDKP
jgi:hypothetical protein